MAIKDWNIDDRPREKFMLKGKNACSNSEVLAILIGMGTRSQSAVEIAKTILSDHDNSLEKLSKLTIADLTKYKGVGKVKAVKIAAALELGSRRLSETPEKKTKISSSYDAYKMLHVYFQGLTREEFYIVFLSNANRVIGVQQLSIGNSKSTIVDIKYISKQALDCHAAGVILAHNHPSGNLKPSATHIDLTEKVKKALALFEIQLLDHLILYENTYHSISDGLPEQ